MHSAIAVVYYYHTFRPGRTLLGGLSFDSIPEPSGIALLGLAGLVLIFRRRK